MHGFVELDSVEGAQQALKSLSDAKFMGRRLRSVTIVSDSPYAYLCSFSYCSFSRLNWAFGNVAKLPPRNVVSWTQVHISFSTNRLDCFVTEEFLDALFTKYGEIADITVKKHLRTVDPPSQSGYAFVYYYEGNSGVTAVQEMKRVIIDGIRLECSLSYRSEQAIQAVMAATTSPLTAQIVSNNIVGSYPGETPTASSAAPAPASLPSSFRQEPAGSSSQLQPPHHSNPFPIPSLPSHPAYSTGPSPLSGQASWPPVSPASSYGYHQQSPAQFQRPVHDVFYGQQQYAALLPAPSTSSPYLAYPLAPAQQTTMGFSMFNSTDPSLPVSLDTNSAVGLSGIGNSGKSVSSASGSSTSGRYASAAPSSGYTPSYQQQHQHPSPPHQLYPQYGPR